MVIILCNPKIWYLFRVIILSTPQACLMVVTRIYDPSQHEQEVGHSTTRLRMVGRIVGVRSPEQSGNKNDSIALPPE